MPFELSVRVLRESEEIEFRVLTAAERTEVARGAFAARSIPLDPESSVVVSNSIILGHDASFDRLILEFGEKESRLGLVPVTELRTVLGACHWPSAIWMA